MGTRAPLFMHWWFTPLGVRASGSDRTRGLPARSESHEPSQIEAGSGVLMVNDRPYYSAVVERPVSSGRGRRAATEIVWPSSPRAGDWSERNVTVPEGGHWSRVSLAQLRLRFAGVLILGLLARVAAALLIGSQRRTPLATLRSGSLAWSFRSPSGMPSSTRSCATGSRSSRSSSGSPAWEWPAWPTAWLEPPAEARLGPRDLWPRTRV
jgi:hypothetical protein